MFTNFLGQPLVSEHKSGSLSWITARQYDSAGRQTQLAYASAVTGYMEMMANLSVTYRTADVLIRLTDYYSAAVDRMIARFFGNSSISFIHTADRASAGEQA